MDILPSELPREASEHFGSCLYSFLPDLVQKEFQSEELKNATIAEKGNLTKSYEYIQSMRAMEKEGKKEVKDGVLLRLEGHLFDFKIINKVLDLIESKNGKFKILHTFLSQSRGGPLREKKSHTTVLLKVGSDDKEENETDLVKRIANLISESPKEAEVTLDLLSNPDQIAHAIDEAEIALLSKKETASFEVVEDNKKKKEKQGKNVLIFGAGLVASPAIEFLSRTQRVTVIAETKEEKERIRRTIKNEVEVIVNGRIDLNSFDLKKLISSSSSSASFDCILSLLPYTMHHDVCKQAIEMNIPFVTASYVGDLEKLRNLSVQRNVPILCEMGLDPGKMERRKRTTIHKQYYYLGLDILTASKELSEIKQAGLKLTSFEFIHRFFSYKR